jgi:hypothetical protein
LYADLNLNNQFDVGDLNVLAPGKSGGYFKLRYTSNAGNQVASNGNTQGYLINDTIPCIEELPPRNYTLEFNPNAINYANANGFSGQWALTETSNSSFTIFLGTVIINTNTRFYHNDPVFIPNTSTANLSGKLWHNQEDFGPYNNQIFDQNGNNDIIGLNTSTHDFDYDNDLPYPGVEVRLQKCGGGYGETQQQIDNWNANPPTYITDANGDYSFSSIPPGAYAVLRNGTFALENSKSVNRQNYCDYSSNRIWWNNNENRGSFGWIEPGTNVTGYNIVTQYLSDITVKTFLDQNLNGTYENFETEGIVGASFNLVTQANNLIDATRSIGGGATSFNGVKPDSYTINMISNNSPYPPFTTTQPVTIAPGNNDQTALFGFTPTANSSISGKIFVDRNRNAGFEVSGLDNNFATTFDNDVVLPSYTVELYIGSLISSAAPDRLVATTTSDANGNYSFTGLTEGYYSARIITPTAAQHQCARCDWGYNFVYRYDIVKLEKDQNRTENLTYDYSGRLDLDAFYDVINNSVYDSEWEVYEDSETYQVTYQDGTVATGLYNNRSNLPPGNYTINIQNMPFGAVIRNGYTNPNTITISDGEQRYQEYPYQPFGDNVIQGRVFADKNIDANYQPNGVDNNASLTFDNDLPIDGTVTVTGALGTYSATTDADGYYVINNLPSGKYLFHTFPVNSTNQSNPIPNITFNTSMGQDLQDRCMTGVEPATSRCKYFDGSAWIWSQGGGAYSNPGYVVNGVRVRNADTVNSDNIYVYTNDIQTRCIDDLNGDGLQTYYPDSGYTEAAISGCSFRLETANGEFVNITNQSGNEYSMRFIPSGNYFVELLNNPSGKVLTNAQRYIPPTTNYGPVLSAPLILNNGNLYQDANYNFFQFSSPTTSNASITGKVFLDKNEDSFYQVNGLDGNANTVLDNEQLLKDVTIKLLKLSDSSVQTTVTSGSYSNLGEYQFTDLSQGQYRIIAEVNP